MKNSMSSTISTTKNSETVISLLDITMDGTPDCDGCHAVLKLRPARCAFLPRAGCFSFLNPQNRSNDRFEFNE